MTTDAEAFFFLHDLITSYVKEKERVLSIQQKTMESYQSNYGDKTQASAGKVPIDNKAANSSGSQSDKQSTSVGDKKHKIDPLHNDWRRFECNTWHLEPTVRLISTFGSQIEPYGVDLILSKLGFSHARTTIPKWLQRGCMDPMDKIMSIIVLNAIQSVKEDPKHQSTNQQHEEQTIGAETGGTSYGALKTNIPTAASSSVASYYSSTPNVPSSRRNDQHKSKAFP